jgi:hypothetical protein
MIDPTCSTCMQRILDMEPEAHEAHCNVPHDAGDHLTALAQRYVDVIWDRSQRRTLGDMDMRDYLGGN